MESNQFCEWSITTDRTMRPKYPPRTYSRTSAGLQYSSRLVHRYIIGLPHRGWPCQAGPGRGASWLLHLVYTVRRRRRCDVLSLFLVDEDLSSRLVQVSQSMLLQFIELNKVVRHISDCSILSFDPSPIMTYIVFTYIHTGLLVYGSRGTRR